MRGFGAPREEAFEQAALTLTAVVTDPALVRPIARNEFACDAPDDELLLADWLNALIYSMGTDFMLYSRFEVIMTATGLQAGAWGEKLDIARHHPAVEVKGVTITELAVRPAADHAGLARKVARLEPLVCVKG